MGLRDTWGTPQYIVDALKLPAHTIDVAASIDNRKFKGFIDANMNALHTPWGRINFCNPPYSSIASWVDAAIERMPESSSWLLLPVRSCQKWFRKAFCEAAVIDFYQGRIQFLPPEGIEASANPERSALFIFSSELDYKSVVRWRSAKTGLLI